MKKTIACLLVIFVMFSLLSSCIYFPKVSQTDSQSNPSVESTDSASVITPSMTPTPSEDIDDISAFTEKISFEDYGISVSPSYFYWSPSTNYAVFIGHVKDSGGKYTPNVYLLQLNDGKITKIADGAIDENYYLFEPRWSEDETLFTVSFHNIKDTDVESHPIRLYDIVQGKTETLPVFSYNPSISPDKSRVAYSGKDGILNIYNLDTKTNTPMPTDIKGFSPIWFSDNNRVLFIKMTGENPSGMEGADLKKLCIIDITTRKITDTFGEGDVLNSIGWLTQDEAAWIESGWDDGHYFNVFDVSSSKMTDKIDSVYVNYMQCQVINKKMYFIIFADDIGYQLKDKDMKTIGVFAAKSVNGGFPECLALSLLSENSLLCLMNGNDGGKGQLFISFLNENRRIPISDHAEKLVPKISRNSGRIAFFYNETSDKEGKQILILDTSKIK